MSAVLPYDTAFSLRSFLRQDEPALSPDGKWLAYSVFTPPMWTSWRDLPAEPHYLPSGTPRWAVGLQLYLTETATGKTRLLGPDECNSWRPSWSPDSRRLAFFCDAAGGPQLWLYEVGQPQAAAGTDVRLKPNLFRGDEAIWNPEGTELYVRLRPAGPLDGCPTETELAPPASDAPTVTAAYSGEEERLREDTSSPDRRTELLLAGHNAALAAVNLHSGAIRIVVPAEADPPPGCMRLSPSGKWVSYLSVPRAEDPASLQLTNELVLVPASGGPPLLRVGPIRRGGVSWLGIYEWHPDRDWLLYVQDRRLWLVDLTTGSRPSPQPLAPEVGDLMPAVMGFTRDGQCTVVRPVGKSGSASRGPNSLALVPLDGSEPKTITAKGLVVSIALTTDGRTLWQPEPKALTVSFRDAETSERVIARLDLESGEARRLRQGEFHLQWFAAGTDHRSAMGIFESVETPPDVYEVHADLSQGKRITRIEPRLDGVQVGSVVSFETLVRRYDGTVKPAKSCLLLPPGAKAGDKMPTLVEIYPGGPTWHQASLYGGGEPSSVPALLFTTRGFAILLPDLSNRPDGMPGNRIQDTMDVLLPQVFHAVELGYVDLQRVALIGQSHGGYGVAGLLAQTNLFRAGVAINGSYDLPGQYAEEDPRGHTDFIAWSESGHFGMGTHPWGDLRRYLANSPYYQADKIETPLLLIHGAKDWLSKDTRKMFQALKRLGKTAQVATYAGEGHVVSDWSRMNASDAARRIVEFLDRYVRGTEA